CLIANFATVPNYVLSASNAVINCGKKRSKRSERSFLPSIA
ncbi:hypothetical protein HMPREF1617_01521, partial [Escherichia coli 908675]